MEREANPVLARLCGTLILVRVPAIAQNGGTADQSTAAAEQDNNIVKQVIDRLTGITDYGVFDSLRFAFKGKTIVLKSYASRPTLKLDAERAVKEDRGR